MSTNKSLPGGLFTFVVFVLLLPLILSGCSEVLSAALGSGPNIAANGQIGAENSQTIGVVTQVEPQNVEQLVVENRDFPLLILFIVALIVGLVGWFVPQPKFIKRWTDGDRS